MVNRTAAPSGRVRWSKAMVELRDRRGGLPCPQCGDSLAGGPVDLAADLALLAGECRHDPQWRRAARLRLLDVHGAAALAAYAGRLSGDELGDLAAVEDAAALALLTDHLAEPVARKAVLRAAARWPVAMLDALLSRTPALTSHAGQLTRDLLGTHPDWAAQVASGPHAAVAARLIQAPAGPFAPGDSWPALVASPPWTRPAVTLPSAAAAPPSQPPVLHVDDLPPDRVLLSPGEHADRFLAQNAARDPRVAAAPGDEAGRILHVLGVAELDRADVLAGRPPATPLQPIQFAWALLRGLEPDSIAALLPPALACAGIPDGDNAALVLRAAGPCAVPVLGPRLWSGGGLASLTSAVEWDGLAPGAAVALQSRWRNADARAWLTRYPAAAARGLLAAALGDRAGGAGGAAAASAPHAAPDRMAAIEALRVAAQADPVAVERVAAVAGVAAQTRALLAIDPALLAGPPPPLPELLPVGLLPRPVVRDAGRPLPSEAMPDLLRLLALDDPDLPYIGAERTLTELDAVAPLAHALLEWWVRHGQPRSERWIVALASRAGDPAVAARLAGIVIERRIAKDRVAAYDALAALVALTDRAPEPAGADAALSQLARLAARPRMPDIVERANTTLAATAAARGLTVDELADRTVPDLGLDAASRLALDAEGRTITARLTPELAVELSAGGKRITSLPRGATEAAAALRALRAGASRLATELPARLERAMVTGRTWTPAEFEALIAGHPVVRLIASRLVWAAGERTFRPALDGELTDAVGDPVALPQGPVRLPHPLTLDAPDTARWRAALAEDAVVAPFPQLDRFTAAAPAGADLPGVGQGLSMGALLGLEGRGWERVVGDGGMVTTYRRPVGPATLAVTVVDGWFVGDRPDPSARTTIASVALEQPGVTWADLPPVAVSEGARDVHLLLGGAG